MRSFVLKIRHLLALYLILAGIACTRIDTEELKGGKITVGLTFDGSGTKTVLDPSAAAFIWEKGDKIALWASPSDDVSASGLSAQPFTLVSRDGAKAFFTSTLSSSMTPGEYVYRLSYPQPQSLDGDNAIFSLPSIQDGTASGGVGIVVSDTFQSTELRALDESSPVDESLSFRARLHHILHYLRFYVPLGNDVLGEPVTRIEFSMPQAVSGDVRLNLSDGTALLSGTSSSKMVIDLDDPVQNGEFISAGIFPPASVYGEGDEMNIRVFSSHKYSDLDPINLSGRDFQAGHITSVPLKVRSAEDLYTIRFLLGSNNLGEEVQNITISFDTEAVICFEKCQTLTINKKDGSNIGVGESFEFMVSSDRADVEALSGKTATIKYESENAIVSEKITFPLLGASQTVLPVVLNCPYLMYEDFSWINSFSSNDAYKVVGGDDSMDAFQFGEWWGARIGGDAGNAIRLGGHRKTVFGIGKVYPARCDSPFFTIKEGKSVDVVVSFNYSMNREETNGNGDGMTVYVGWSDKQGGLKSSDETGTFDYSFKLNENTGGYSNINHNSGDIEIKGMTSAKRLSIRDVPDKVGGIGSSGNYWLYIDNIKVQIKK